MKNRLRRSFGKFRMGLLIVAMVLGVVSSAQALPGFSKAFFPDTIGPGSASTLVFTIDNAGSLAAADLAFTDVLPAGVTIATPASAFTDCADGFLSAPPGGTTIELSGARLGVNGACIVTVNVIGTATATNVSGDLTSSVGNSGAATATLTVDPARPGFSKSFSPSSISLGGTSTLTFLIDNTAPGAVDASTLSFFDALPPGMVVATPANAATTCTSATLTATSGTSSISLVAPVLAAEASCTVSVDVTTDTTGVFVNTSGELQEGEFGTPVSSGFATAVLDVPVEFLVKSFTDDPVPPGGTVTLQFTITNLDRSFPATSIAFDDDLDPLGSLTGLAPGETLPKPACGGALDFAAGTLSLTGGSLAAGGSCVFNVQLEVPGGAAPGTFTNVTAPITASIDGQGIVGNAATDNLVVSTVPIFTKEFIDDPTAAGAPVTLRFTITNSDPDSDLTGIAFTDDLNAAIPGLAANSLVAGLDPAPLVNPCGAGSELTVSDPNDTFPPPPNLPPDPTQLIFTGGSLAAAGLPGDSCTFDVILDVPVGTPQGSFVNTTSDITGVVDTCGDGCLETISGLPASGDLLIVGAPQLTKSFTDDPVIPGGTVTLAFTLTHAAEAPSPATGITFTDDLNAVLAGLTATGLPAPACGGTLSGTTNLTFTGGTLTPGASCTFSVTLDVPGGVGPGSYKNTTSDVTATVSGLATSGNPATDDLQVAGLTLIKEFTDDPVIPGQTANLLFTLGNTGGTADATNIFFTDDLNAVVTGLVATAPLPVNPCGGILSGTNLLTFTGGSVPAGTSCQFSVTLQTPLGAVSNMYTNVTSALTADIGGVPTVLSPAVDQLTLESNLLLLGKAFTDDPVVPGGNVTLEFTLTNAHPTLPATGIGFSDDLGAALPGLAATGLPAAACGGTLSGTTTLTLAGGSLAAGASCTFSTTLTVPAAAPLGGTITNTTSQVTGTIDGLPVTGDPASDNLQVELVSLNKAFGGTALPGGTVLLSFTIQNLDTVNAVNNLGFQDDLSAVLPGFVATGLPAAACGGTVSGTNVIALAGGSLGAGASCTFNVTLLVPAGAAPGSYLNTTGNILAGGLIVGTPATDALAVAGLPGFTKSFGPATIMPGGTSALGFVIDNTANAMAVTSLAFTDNLPAGLLIASPSNAASSCIGGTLTAVSGTGVITYSGGTVSAGSACVISVDVTGSTLGTHVNTTGNLTSSLGSSAPATATLAIVGAAVVQAPTLSEWGLMVLGGLLGFAAFLRLRSRQQGGGRLGAV